MKGFVPTPASVVDLMVEKLFTIDSPRADTTLLDPGCGRGAFVDGVIRWCAAHDVPIPRIRGIESDMAHVRFLRERFSEVASVEIINEDFLAAHEGSYDFIIGNPPYVSITALSETEKELYRRSFFAAKGRFDLYLLFLEQALRLLKPCGRLVFITPEKYLYTETAAPLRKLLSKHRVEEFHFLDEHTFAGFVTYPLVTTVNADGPTEVSRVIERDGSKRSIAWTPGEFSWIPVIRGAPHSNPSLKLADVSVRISCGIATGADSVFVVRNSALPAELHPYAYPSVAGRDIVSCELPALERSLLVPYDSTGTLLPERQLGSLGEYLSVPSRRAKLLARTCVLSKPWYAFHETPPLKHVLRPKIICKDIGAAPFFVVDRTGVVIPRHSLYYIVPRSADRIDELAEYLNSPVARRWLRDHCQRAANNFLRLQSHVLRHLPLPPSLATMATQVELEVPLSSRRYA